MSESVKRNPILPKPIIGLAGGVGSGKSTIAGMFAQLGCAVIDSDALAHAALEQPEVQAQLRAWWGDDIILPGGQANRKKIASVVFNNAMELNRLNGLVHPWVAAERAKIMREQAQNNAIKAIVWDSPLLFESGLNRQCTAVVFVKVPLQERLRRLEASRGWVEPELKKRENLQISLDKKAEMSDYTVDNSGDAASSFRQVRFVLSQILTKCITKVIK